VYTDVRKGGREGGEGLHVVGVVGFYIAFSSSSYFKYVHVAPGGREEGREGGKELRVGFYISSSESDFI